MHPDPVATAIASFRPRGVDEEAASFARELAASAHPESVNRAKAFLFAAFGEACVNPKSHLV
jgi:hypothetical protein